MSRQKTAPIEALVRTADGWLRMRNPIEIVEAWEPGGVRSAIGRAEDLAIRAAVHAVGFVTYEAGVAFGVPACAPPPDLPLVWFATFAPADVEAVDGPSSGGGYELQDLRPSIAEHAFRAAFARIRDHIADGDTYQVNFTFRMQADFRGDARTFFADLAAAQQGGYATFLDTGRHVICSASPELFFARSRGVLVARPMKGTAARGRTLADDRRAAADLHQSPKQRAENVMIVDMVRNDLGRVAAIGSVEVPALFTVERYPNAWQMTSTVTARSQAALPAVFEALHPSASVTGAPKVRTAEIIRALERAPRGIYTGAVGHISPGGDARFNVAIRTAVIDRTAARLEFGVGSGIVWESDVASEFDECRLKGSVLGRRPLRFDLLETLRWSAGEGFFLLDRHLERLRDSAEYFGYACRPAEVRAALEAAVRTAGGASGPLRLRLLVSGDGAVRVETAPLPAAAAPLKVELADAPVDAGDVFLFHKTTNRRAYDRARGPGSDDVILWNGRGEVTEATTANVVVEKDGLMVTPPVGCGLLGGTFRAELLAQGSVTEAVVTVGELLRAPRVWLVNSVHRWRQAVVVREKGALV